MASVQAQDLLTPTAKALRLSATLEINELVRQRLDAGKQVVHLGFGEATFPMQEDVLQAHREASSDTSYLPVAGLPALREVNISCSTNLFLKCRSLRLYSLLHGFRRAV
jgi:aspartate aminotransferase